MKKLTTVFILVAILTFIVTAKADVICNTLILEEEITETKDVNTDVPKFLEGATIIVRLKNGTESSVPAEKFKVVPRKQQFLVSKIKQVDKTSCVAKHDLNRNRLSLAAGNGTKEGLDRSTDGTTVTVESKTGAVGGAQYQRLLPALDDRLSIGAQVQTNKTLLLNIGLDF